MQSGSYLVVNTDVNCRKFVGASVGLLKNFGFLNELV